MRDLRPLFNPRSVAIVGASATVGKWGNWLAQSALRGKDQRRVFLVNRSGGDILGERSFRSLQELPEAPELVVVAIGSSGFERAVDDALAAGARAIVGITAGLGEMGGSSREIERRVSERVRAAGAVLVGPNCLGLADTGTGLNLAYGEFVAGSLAVVSQSGNIALELARLAAAASLGISRFVSLGNQADLNVTELMQALMSHTATRVIAVYVEDFTDGRAFAETAMRAQAAGKPVVLLTVGSSRAGARAARSHTGALVSESVAVDAACRGAGILRVSTPRELIDVAQALLMRPQPRGRRVGVVGDGGGHVALAADLLSARGLELPQLSEALASRIAARLPSNAAVTNPVDLAGGGEEDFFNYANVVRQLRESGEVDSVLLTGYFGGYSEDDPQLARAESEVAAAMAGQAEQWAAPLIVHTMYPAAPTLDALRGAQVPIYGDTASAVNALARVVERAAEPPRGVPVLPPSSSSNHAASGYFEARRELAAAGIGFAEARQVGTAAEARAAAVEIGYPVVLKAVGVEHKSDAGGVIVDITSDAELSAAVTELSTRMGATLLSVERMVHAPGAVELLIGARWDHAFGPVLLVGAGGVMAELLRDVAVALAPVTAEDAEALIRKLRIAPRLLGHRGSKLLDITAAARAASALSSLAASRPDLHEIEVNPLLVMAAGILALDARVVTA